MEQLEVRAADVVVVGEGGDLGDAGSVASRASARCLDDA